MKRIVLKSLLCSLIALVTKPASAQSHQLIGTWQLIAADKIIPDGKRVADYGLAPHGIAIFTTDGHYVVEIFGTERTKFASGYGANGTPEEYKSTLLGLSCHFGTYSMDPNKGTITFHIDRASNPNIDQIIQVRTFMLQGDTLSWRVPARADGTVPVSEFKRI
jgi:hypothetical protein